MDKGKALPDDFFFNKHKSLYIYCQCEELSFHRSMLGLKYPNTKYHALLAKDPADAERPPPPR